MVAVRRKVAPAAPKPKRRENAVLSDIRLAIGSRPDMLAVRVAAGLFDIPGGKGGKVRAAPDGTPDLLCTWRREITVHHVANRDGFTPHERIVTHVIGQSVYIETKRLDGGVQSDEQKAFQSVAEQMGALYILARSVAEVEAVIGPPHIQNRIGD